MNSASTMLVTARAIMGEMRDQGAGLNNTDQSVWFVFGALKSMHQLGHTSAHERAADKLAYAVYLADLLAGSCRNVTSSIQLTDDGAISEVLATQRQDDVFQFIVSWLFKCVDDPDADNIVFKYAGALQDFGEPTRATVLYEPVADYQR